MNGRSLVLNPRKSTEIFLILHERAHRPKGLEYEYMTGRLVKELGRKAYGKVLTPAGQRRARSVGKFLASAGLALIVTDDFIVPYETAFLIAKAAGRRKAIPVHTDQRVRESDLSYLSRARFTSLGETEAAGDPNATIRDWIHLHPEDFEDLVCGHVALWNELVSQNAGSKYALVLHVEGFLLYPTLLLGCPAENMISLHIPRAHPVHVRLWPNRLPVVSFGDEHYWKSRLPTIFAQYS